MQAQDKPVRHRRSVKTYMPSMSLKATYHARCTCGWRGSSRRTREEAEADLKKHTW